MSLKKIQKLSLLSIIGLCIVILICCLLFIKNTETFETTTTANNATTTTANNATTTTANNATTTTANNATTTTANNATTTTANNATTTTANNATTTTANNATTTTANNATTTTANNATTTTANNKCQYDSEDYVYKNIPINIDKISVSHISPGFMDKTSYSPDLSLKSKNNNNEIKGGSGMDTISNRGVYIDDTKGLLNVFNPIM